VIAFSTPLAFGYSIYAVREAPDRGWAILALLIDLLFAALIGLMIASALFAG
jgi:hypothetical protein